MVEAIAIARSDPEVIVEVFLKMGDVATHYLMCRRYPSTRLEIPEIQRLSSGHELDSQYTPRVLQNLRILDITCFLLV